MLQEFTQANVVSLKTDERQAQFNCNEYFTKWSIALVLLHSRCV